VAYFGEFARNPRQLGSAALGIAAGYTITNYLNNLFIPRLMTEFGWSSSQIALLGLAAVLSILCQPLAGRMTDRFGVRPVALFGVVGGGLMFLALSRQTGSFAMFFALNTAQIALISSTTGPVVWSRLIAERFDRARGLALALATSAPSFAGMVVTPLAARYIESAGWRSGYLLTASVTTTAGLLAIALVPRHAAQQSGAASPLNAAPMLRSTIRSIARNPAFPLIIGGILLCSMTIVMQTTQMQVILTGRGLNGAQAAWAISSYALGVIAGRLGCGAALDRFPAHAVAAVALGLPGIGLALLALGPASPAVLSLAVAVLGLSLGAEGDVGGFLAMRYFSLEVYSTFLGVVVGTIAVSSALGSLLLSLTLGASLGFAPFLLLAGGSALAGGALLWRLGRVPPARIDQAIPRT